MPKLRPLQWVGLAAIIVFGGILIWTLMPKPAPAIAVIAAAPAAQPPAAPEPAQPAPPAEPLAVGSQDAKDDLYCSGLIFAVHSANAHDTLSPAADKRRADVVKLAEAGVNKLKAEGVATDATSGAIADAHSAKASEDLDRSNLRIPYETCVARADAIPNAR
jgi:hypothetical protein